MSSPHGTRWTGALILRIAGNAPHVQAPPYRTAPNWPARLVLTVFATILLAEIGGKSQIAAALSSAQEGSPLPLIGTNIGAIAINLPVAIAGPLLAEKLILKGINLRWVARFTAVLFASLGVFAIIGLMQAR
jgi:putative Ca2+/H+ antiporter (TMEM165/GDT1 family)